MGGTHSRLGRERGEIESTVGPTMLSSLSSVTVFGRRRLNLALSLRFGGTTMVLVGVLNGWVPGEGSRGFPQQGEVSMAD